MSFSHLHVHSHYSLLDGLSKIPDLVNYAKTQGFESLALTDHGAMHGIVEFYKAATEAELKPILGVETYVAPRALTDKQAKLDDANYHLVLLARNLTGYKNLLKLVSIAHLQGFYYKPRLDHETLARHSEGLVALSACLKGEIPQALKRGDEKTAQELARWYAQTFGENNFYLEIQAHPELTEQVDINKKLKALAKELSLPLIATNDSHYLQHEDAEAQDILVCIQTGKTVEDANRLNLRQVNTSLKSEAQMRNDLPDYQEAITNAGILAKELNVKLELGKRFFPSYPTPEGQTAEIHLRLLAEEGLTKHYHGEVPESVRTRMEYELDIIMTKGYATYFLVVSDFVNWARGNGIIATTRGSAAGSLVSFLIGITTINPLIYGLPFERFLNPQRPSPPDIDMDFADNRRDEVIAYVTAKYGLDRVAQIVTFGTMAARAAVRDVGRALGYAYGLCDKIAKLIPFGSQGFHMTIQRALTENEELCALYEADPQIKRLLDLAQKVEGCARHASVHAAGVVISPSSLTDYTPLQYDTEGQHITTQYDMWSCEDAGLIKMDFLGIRNLSIMGSAITIIEKTKQIKINLDTIPLNDDKTFALMARGETMGMFQLGGSGMTRYLKELKPERITDIMAMVALFRPGPMNSIPEFIKRKHNPKTISYLHPKLKDILNVSYGIITYQDDVLLIAIELAGYSWEEADKLRKAMGKKIKKEMARQKEKFISGCITHGGLTENKARELWELIEPFAAYGFNKAHAASYAIVAYQTAYLKANFPTAFMAALMTAESGDLETIAQAVNECAHMGIIVLPPDINQSLLTFTVVDDKNIRFGLAAIKNLGEQVIESLIRERKINGLFTSLENFLERTAGREINKKSLESLIKSGALDSLHPERQQLLNSLETLLSFSKENLQARLSNQSSLFDMVNISNKPVSQLKLAPQTQTSNQEKLAWEKELLGLYVSAHPFTEYAKSLAGYFTPLKSINEFKDNQIVKVAGFITKTKPITTKRGEAMAFATLEDDSGATELVIFPDTYKNTAKNINANKVFLVRARISKRDGEVKLIAESLNSTEGVEEAKNQAQAWITSTNNKYYNPIANREVIHQEQEYMINLPATATREMVESLKKLIHNFPGDQKVVFTITHGIGLKKVVTPYRVKPTSEFLQACKEILS